MPYKKHVIRWATLVICVTVVTVIIGVWQWWVE